MSEARRAERFEALFREHYAAVRTRSQIADCSGLLRTLGRAVWMALPSLPHDSASYAIAPRQVDALLPLDRRAAAGEHATVNRQRRAVDRLQTSRASSGVMKRS